MDGLPQAEVAQALARAKIFLLGNEREGLGLPGLEAMASGCVTIGFHGGGGREYAHYPLCHTIEDGDLVGFIEAVELHALMTDAPVASDIDATRDLIARDHGREAFEAEAVAAFRELSEIAAVKGQPSVEHLATASLRRARSLRGRVHKLGSRLRHAVWR